VKRQRTQSRGEAGDSLIEILAAVAIIAMTLTVLVLSLSTGALGVRTANRLTTATNLAAAQLESIKATEYVTGTASYPTIPTDGYTISQEISYWDGTSFTSVPGDDSGMQWITVTVSYGGDALVIIGNYKVNR
jgi:type II secretory pathway pseudopilin PulG